MRLGAKILTNVIDINHFQYANQARVSEGQANDIYIRLVDNDWSLDPKKNKSFISIEDPIRYLSQAGAILVTAKFLSIDDSKEFDVTATQPFADDKSIFKFSLTNVQIPNAGNFIIEINEDGTIRSFVMKQSIEVDLLEVGGC